MLNFFSSRWIWDSSNPSLVGEYAPSLLVLGGGAHSLARKGVGESQFRRGDIHCGILYIYVLCGFSNQTDQGDETGGLEKEGLERGV